MYNLAKENYCNRNLSLDMVRLVAIAAVIMIHISAGFVMKNEIGSSEFVWGNIFDSVSRIGVPLFIMTSGALMLDPRKQVTINEIFYRRLPKILILLLMWSIFYAVMYKIMIPVIKVGQIDFSIKAFIIDIALGYYHLWYLYMQAGLYVAVLFLRILAVKKNQNLVLIYLLISALFQFTIPIIKGGTLYFKGAEQLIIFIEKFQLGFFNVFIAYFLLGWYIVHIGISKRMKVALYLSSLLALLLMIIYVHISKDYTNAYSNSGIFVFIYSAGIFTALNSINIKPNKKSLFISNISKYSFGIYVVHVILLEEVTGKLLSKITTPPIYMLSCWTLTFIVSLTATFVMSRIPYIKKLVRM